jgi:hypothetical protein
MWTGGQSNEVSLPQVSFIVAAALLTDAWSAEAQVSQETLDSLSTPDKVETSIGTLEFKDGAPSVETAEKVYDALDFTRALNVYNNSFRGASALAIKKGLQSIGLQSRDVAITSKLLDADSLFLTANADTLYYMAWIDLSNGPVVIEQPPEGLGTINDMWFSWVIDAGKPGPDRGLGGEPKIPETKFIEISGKSFNTIPPSDYEFFEMINENVQEEPATSYDVELAGQLAAIGIVHGKEFKPDAQMKKILSDAAAVGNANGRALNWRFTVSHPDWAYYPDSHWGNMLFEGGAFFETPPPAYEGDGKFKPYPPTGARTLDSRTAFYYAYTLDSPGMIMRIPGVGSQYLMGFLDKDGNPFDGAKTYKVTLPKGIPAAAFWSLTLYDNQTRSMLQTPQKYPRAGSQSYPLPAAEAVDDGSTTIYFAPEQSEGVARGNWIQTDPKKGWFTILRLYSPLPSFFDKSWRLSEIELVN